MGTSRPTKMDAVTVAPRSPVCRTRRRRAGLAAVLSLSLVTAAACGSRTGDFVTSEDFEPTGAPPAAELAADGVLAGPGELSGRIEGAGATFPNTLFGDWLFEYGDTRSDATVQPGVQVDYQSIGSGGGIEQFLRGTVDWGTSERYLRDEDLEVAEENRGCPAVQVPVVFGSVVIAFEDENLDGLVLDAATVSAIYRREITRYDDERIRALNPDRDLPSREIIPVHRSDGSGTTSVFTTWLEDEDATWAEEYGSGTEVTWASGTLGGDGNEGVAAGIEQNPGGMGYVNQSYSTVLGLAQARVVNADGNAVYPSLTATMAALEDLDIPDSFQFDVLGVGGDGYPVVGTVWNFFFTCGYTERTATLLRDFWAWATQTDEGDRLALELAYVPLGPSLKERVLTALDRINEEER
jgi:phosphate transport system substrate-binding protein